MAAEWFPLPIQGKQEREHLYQWMTKEEAYVSEKFDNNKERARHDATLARYNIDEFWAPQVIQYMDRARMYMEMAGLSPPTKRRDYELRAQQAICKGMMTFKGMAESCIRVYGKLPTAGVSSGEIEEFSTEEKKLLQEIFGAQKGHDA